MSDPQTVAVGLSVTAVLINLIPSVILPNVVALVTKKLSAAWYKGVVLLFLTSVSGVVVQILTAPHGGFDWKGWILSWTETFIVAVGVHFGILKGVTTGSAGIIQTRIPQGIGINQRSPHRGRHALDPTLQPVPVQNPDATKPVATPANPAPTDPTSTL
jgi:hypothetical protein